ncbi:hypothetical protein D9753_08835 [Streptomyces dangxiongensis]|uniref:Uncharacterized protein n=1 Tax=Streptomyces dangxiongensis TaxID=1442032 RepID=A0A3G2J9M7_9ACTN|nr:hypothetical protein [Streptomyces dangxiongensis]AYN39003.1 hypothetical protein D9753_08835 [Streptomyces dangxiongensis]
MEITGRQLPEGSSWDREVVARDAGQSRLAAGYDLTYRHGPELIFAGPVFLPCPQSFRDPGLRPPTAGTARLARALGEEVPLIVAFEADAGGPEAVSCVIAAERLEVRPGIVPRRLAWGAARPHDWPGPPPPTD